MLSKIKTVVAGGVIRSSDWNAEFNNILNNPITLISPTTGNIDFNSNQAVNFAAENLTSAASGTTPLGRIYYNVGTSSWEGISSTGAVVIGPSTAGSTGGNATGSRVKNLQGVISTNVATFTAQEYVFRTTNAYVASYVTVATSALSVNTRTTFTDAANGRDSVAAFASKEVHWYAISTGALSTAPQGIVSTRPPILGPTMPTSYAGWCYLGASVYSTLSSGVGSSGVTSGWAQHLQGGWTIYDDAPKALSVGSASIETAVSLSTWVPPTADRIKLNFQVGITDTGLPFAFYGAGHTIRAVSGQDAFKTFTNIYAPGAASLVISHGGQVELPQLNAAPSIFYFSTTNSAGTPSMTLYVAGYHNPNGDG